MLSIHQKKSRKATFRGQQEGRKQVGGPDQARGNHAGNAGEVTEFELHPAGNGEPTKVLVAEHLSALVDWRGNRLYEER